MEAGNLQLLTNLLSSLGLEVTGIERANWLENWLYLGLATIQIIIQALTTFHFILPIYSRYTRSRRAPTAATPPLTIPSVTPGIPPLRGNLDWDPKISLRHICNPQNDPAG